MKVRILACIQAAVLALSSFPTTAATISTDNQILAVEAETESETETEAETETEKEEELSSEIEDVARTETEKETLSETEDKTETETKDVMETETEAKTETETQEELFPETEDVMEAETEAETESETETQEEMLSEISTEAGDDLDTAQYLTTIDAVGEKLRQSLTNREAEITVYYQTTKEPDDEIAKEIWNAALEHTGKPTEGDYIRFRYESLEIPDYNITAAVSATTETDETSAEKTYYLPITYKVSYYTTYEHDDTQACMHDAKEVAESFYILIRQRETEWVSETL